MKRVLVITYYWPPAGGSGVQRWVKFAKFLPEEGWQPVIYTPLNPEISSVDETLLSDIPEGTEIIKTRIIEPYGAYRALMGSKSSTDMKSLIADSPERRAAKDDRARGARATGGEVNPISGGEKSFKQKLSLFIRGNFFIPDPRVWWVKPSVRFLKKYLKEHPVDVIVTTGPPQSMHLIGQKLSAATGVPWIPDFRDPWTKMFYFKHLHLTNASDKKHLRMEQKVLDDAAAVIAVSPFVQRDFQAQTATPVHLITNGFDEDDFTATGGKLTVTGDDSNHTGALPDASDRESPSGSVCSESLSEAFTITHTGLFAADGNPETLWDVLEEMCRHTEGFSESLQIRLAGKVDSEITASLQRRGLPFIQLGYLSHAEAVREQQSAWTLILPLRQDPEYRKVLPGKIFEYMASRRPVLGIGQEDGAAAELLRQTGAGVMCSWDSKEATRAAIEKHWQSFRSGDRSAVNSRISCFERRALTHSLAELLNETVCKHR